MYKVTIEKIEDVSSLEKGEWTIVEEVPYSEKDMQGSYDAESYKGKLKPVRGYLEDKLVTKEKSTKVLEQSVEDIDLVSVIKAINNIWDK